MNPLEAATLIGRRLWVARLSVEVGPLPPMTYDEGDEYDMPPSEVDDFNAEVGNPEAQAESVRNAEETAEALSMAISALGFVPDEIVTRVQEENERRMRHAAASPKGEQ